jgi:hypothetical protein
VKIQSPTSVEIVRRPGIPDATDCVCVSKDVAIQFKCVYLEYVQPSGPYRILLDGMKALKATSHPKTITYSLENCRSRKNVIGNRTS